MTLNQKEILRRGQDPFVYQNYFENLSVNIHGMPFQFRTKSKKLIESLKNYFPKESIGKEGATGVTSVYWLSPDEVLGRPVPDWGHVHNPDCHFEGDWVLQRDFAVYRENAQTIFLVAEEKVGDGFFNFLRYHLPLRFLKQGKILFHSSCVVDEKGRAFLFFGHSGAGKTTISKLCGKHGVVLGDDMNLLSVQGHKVLVEPALVGQQIYNRDYFGREFPVEAAFWLVQSKDLQTQILKNGRLNKVLSSFSGLFWDQLNIKDYHRVFELAHQLNSNMKIYNLEFNLTDEVWQHVRKISENL